MRTKKGSFAETTLAQAQCKHVDILALDPLPIKQTDRFSSSFRTEKVQGSVAFRKGDRKMGDLFGHEGTHLVLGQGTFGDTRMSFKDFYINR